MNYQQAMEELQGQQANALFEKMYGDGAVKVSQARYEKAAREYVRIFGGDSFEFFTSPGRTEIGGNHTDHNLGKVLAGSVQMDCVCAAAATDSDEVRIYSEGYPEILCVDLKHLEPTDKTVGSLVLIRGVLAGLKERGFRLGGFQAYVTSNVLSGSGVSSSASFEMLICAIVDYFYNQESKDYVAYAKAGQYAENKYWLKGSGLLDQMACAVGGVVTIDFKNADEPAVRKVEVDFSTLGLDLVIVNTGKGHADLSAEYSAVPNEMKSIAAFFGKKVLAELSEEEVIVDAHALRKQCGDRALLRALHFFEENKRVERQVAALECQNVEGFLKEITASGNSSWKWLQNCYLNEKPNEQPISCALALTECFLADVPNSACRVHGGGFAGVIAVYLPKDYTDRYCAYINKTLGFSAAFKMYIRNEGAIHVTI